jgi:hypothetical protein
MGKIFESVMAETLSYLTETYRLLPKHHYGGRPGQSTEDALMALSESAAAQKVGKNDGDGDVAKGQHHLGN